MINRDDVKAVIHKISFSKIHGRTWTLTGPFSDIMMVFEFLTENDVNYTFNRTPMGSLAPSTIVFNKDEDVALFLTTINSLKD